MADLETFNFRLYHEEGSLELLPGFKIARATGRVSNPDRLAVSFNGTYGNGYSISADVVTIGNTTYMTNPLTGRWEGSDLEVSPLGFFNPTEGISGMMGRIDNAEISVESDGGSRRFLVTGNLPTEAMMPLVGNTLQDATVAVELTIDAETFHLHQVRFDGSVTPTDQGNVERVIVLSFFNEEVTIEAPEGE